MLYSDVPASNHLPTCVTLPRGHIFKSIHYVCASMYYTVVQLHKTRTSLDTQSRYKTPRCHREECARISCLLWACNHIDSYTTMPAHRVRWNMHVFVKTVLASEAAIQTDCDCCGGGKCNEAACVPRTNNQHPSEVMGGSRIRRISGCVCVCLGGGLYGEEGTGQWHAAS